MSFFSRLFGGNDENDAHEPPIMPWDQRPSILEFVRSHIAHGQSGMIEGGDTLPDEERVVQGSKISWAAGAMDGVATHHMESGGNDVAIQKTVELVLAYSRQPTVENKASVYQHVISEHIVSIIDPVIEALVNEKGLNHERLYELAHSFVTESPDREPVKFGIAILGLFRETANEGLFQTLGRHDEFTLFCAVAIANASDDSQDSLWTLAQNVTGWGRVHAVERLAKSATNPAIKNWLLREGFRNSIMYEYLAGTCARAGGLLAALSEETVDRELLTAAGEMIVALIAGGPADSMDDYEDARPVIEYYLGHMTTYSETILDFLHVNAIQSYLAGDESRWKDRFDAGWTTDCRDRLRSQCVAILGRPEWSNRIRAMLSSEDEVEFAHANQAAKALGIDTWTIHWQRLQEKSSDPGRWYQVMVLCNDDRIEMVTKSAEANLDLGGIATGAADELGFGRAFQPHSCLDYIRQELRRFPGRGEKLIEVGLRSPVVRNRNMAVNALAGWSRVEWPANSNGRLKRQASANPTKTFWSECKKC